MSLRLVAGRWLDPVQDTPTGSVVINEALVRSAGWSDAVGRRLEGLNPGPTGLGGFGLEEPVIVGVVQDFHTGEVGKAIRPTVIRLQDQGAGYKALIVRLDPERMPAGLSAIQRVWREVAGDAEYRGFVLGEYLDQQSADTARWARLVRWSDGLALLIAGLSVFGLAAVEVGRRTREIGVRKAMGASVPRLVTLLLWDFTKPVLAANLVAWPAAWLAMGTWLGSFAYHVPLRPGYFILAGLSGILIAWLTGAWHAIRVARADLVEALRQG
jgi:putative ABC transport system permease protein